jgi:hypothetical protein
LKNYTPSPDDGRFAVDLVHALQNGAPLTLLQKIFLVTTVAIPAPFDWKLSFFEFLYNLSFSPVVATVIGGLFVIVVLFLLRKIIGSLFKRKQELVFLEVAFPSTTAKSAYATEQLFTLIHGLARQQTLLEKFFGFKKQYSLEIVATKEEGIRYVLGVSKENIAIIQKSLLSFLPGLKLKEIPDYLSPNLGKNTKVVELKLKNDFALPLKDNKALDEHDPIAYLTGNMTKLKNDELIAFQTVITPITKYNHGSISRHIASLEKIINSNLPLSNKLFGSVWLKVLFIPWEIIKFLARAVSFVLKFFLSMIIAFWDTDKGGSNTPFLQRDQIIVVNNANSPLDDELRTEVKTKIEQPLFEASLRLLIISQNDKQNFERITGFLASFGLLSTIRQTLTIKPKDLISLIFPPLKSFAKRAVSIFGNPVLSVSELADIYHFPYTQTTKTEDLVKSKSQPLPAPLSFKQSKTKFDNVFAKNTYGGSETLIGQTLDERRRHTYILGATGSGKTTLLSNMIYQDIKNGKGVAVLDPHGQLVEKLLAVIPKERIKDVVWFAPDDDEYPIALNLLEIKDENLTKSQLQKQKSLVTSSIISIIQKFYDAKFFGPRMEYILRNTILTALETKDPTLKTILDILTQSKYRKEIVANLKNQVLQEYWVHEFEKLGNLQKNTVISPITNKIGGLLSSPINYNILKQSKSKLDFEEIMNSGKILLCDLSKGKIGEDESSFFGSLVISKIQLAALRRALIPEEERRDFNLYVDEFQNFATPTFSELVSEARKYHLATILAHQSISQIENRDIIKVILANVGTVICFKTANPEDEQFILPIFQPEVSKHEISNLPLYNFYMKVMVGQAQDTFLAEADNFTVKGSDKTIQAVINESRKRYATPVEELDKESPKEKPKQNKISPKSKKQEEQIEGALPS